MFPAHGCFFPWLQCVDGDESRFIIAVVEAKIVTFREGGKVDVQYCLSNGRTMPYSYRVFDKECIFRIVKQIKNYPPNHIIEELENAIGIVLSCGAIVSPDILRSYQKGRLYKDFVRKML